MRLAQALSNALHRWSLRRRQYSGGAQVMDALYGKADPWNLASREEQSRFEATNALILHHCGRTDSVLEIGCGEGHQTGYFLRLAQRVTAIDVSANALARAKVAVPGPDYLEGDILSLHSALPAARYDVATLCEVLYYMDDPARTIGQAQGIADHVIVTIYEPQAPRLAGLFRGEAWRSLPTIHCGRRQWRAYIWSRPDSAEP